MSNDLLRIAIPNKGSLSQSASDILREAGYKQRLDAKQLTLTDADNGVEFFYLRPRDIALYVGEGTLDIGITGRDLLLDSGAKRSCRWASGARASVSLPARARSGRRRTSPASGSRRRTTVWCAATSRSAGSTPR